LGAHHPAVEEREPRRHEQHERGGAEHPRRIPRVDLRHKKPPDLRGRARARPPRRTKRQTKRGSGGARVRRGAANRTWLLRRLATDESATANSVNAHADAPRGVPGVATSRARSVRSAPTDGTRAASAPAAWTPERGGA